MENPIRYEDLFDSNVLPEIKKTSEAITQMHTDLVQMLGSSKRAAESLMKALGETKVSTEQGKASTKQLVLSAQELDERYKNLKKTEQEAADAARALSATKKDLAKVDAQIIKASNAQEDSYNRLAAVYKLATTALNALGKKERETTAYGKQLTQMANEARAAMDAWNKSTGNFTLSVGHYAQGTEAFSKELNGLAIASQQVLREMPTLANSAQQFFVAISNNVPIFVDNFKRVVKVTGSVRAAFVALRDTIISWNTVLLIVLTFLPIISRAIHDKKKALEEDNEETAKQITLLGLLHEAYMGAAQAIGNDTAQTKILIKALHQTNRTYEDRVRIAAELKRINEEQLAAYSAEQIATGEANEAIKTLIANIDRMARAKAYLTAITNNYVKMLELEVDAPTYKPQAHLAATYENLIRVVGQWHKVGYDDQKLLKTTTKYYGQFGDEFVKSAIKAEKFRREMGELEEANKRLLKDIETEDLLSAFSGGRGGEKAYNVPDYYWKALEGAVNLMEDNSKKRLALLDLHYQKESAERRKQEKVLLDIIKNGNEEEVAEAKKQYNYLAIVALDAAAQYEKDVKSFVDGIVKSYSNIEVEEEAFKSIKEEQQDFFNERQRMLQDANSKEYTIWEKGEQSVEELNDKLTENTKQFWLGYLEDLRQAGILTIEEYNRIMAELAKADKKAEKQRGRGRRGYSNPVEALLAHTEHYGETDKYGMKVIKEEYRAYADSVNKALQSTIKSMNEWIDARIQMAEAAIDAAKAETDATKQALDYEREARANGYANNVELARKEYEEKLAIQRKAEAEKAKLDRAQRASDTASQISSLITATANIWEAESLKGLLGVPLAGAATAAMWIAFAAAKNMARKAVTYGDGMSEYLDYGGSHASGHDIDFGHTRDGRPRRVERGEVIGVINKKNVRKYGVGTVTDIIGSLNKGTFEDRYGMAFAGGATISTDLSNVERGLNTLVKQGEKKTIVTNNGVVEYYKNTKKIIHS